MPRPVSKRREEAIPETDDENEIILKLLFVIILHEIARLRALVGIRLNCSCHTKMMSSCRGIHQSST